VSAYGKQYEPFIKEQVYALMPDIAQKRFIPTGDATNLTNWFVNNGVSDAQLLQKAQEATGRKPGWFDDANRIKADYLNQISGVVEQYRKIGFSDSDIQKLILK
jgi:hypothetical protein